MQAVFTSHVSQTGARDQFGLVLRQTYRSVEMVNVHVGRLRQSGNAYLRHTDKACHVPVVIKEHTYDSVI